MKRSMNSTMHEQAISFDDLHFIPTELYEAMGYGDTLPDEMTRAESAAIIKEVREWLQPSFAFFSTEGILDSGNECLTIKQTELQIGSIIARQLRGSEAYAFFTATAGKAFEAYQEKLKQEGDMVKIYIADALGSILAEKTADALEIALEKELFKKEWKHTNRFSPGYCGWHVSEQQKLFSLFPIEEPCGIQLTPSSLMLPIKSVSGVIGLGTQVRKVEYTCGLCSFEQCFRRKQRKH